MTKIGLLIGVNYRGTEAELNGCINDVENVKEMLTSIYDYNENDIQLMTDDTEVKPTLKNIISGLIHIADKSYNDDISEVWISYSGHGSYVTDDGEDEDDNKDECLVPIDYMSSGLLRDDTINHALGLINPNCRVVVVIDACHSETIIDLKYRYISGKKNVVENKHCKIRSNCVMISGCRDIESSYDAYNINNSQEFSGAMTTALLAVLKNFDYTITCWRLLKEMRKFLRKREFSQIPQINCTQKLSCATLFSCVNPKPFIKK